MEKISRYRGCLLGLATGDAMGTTLEFQRPGSFKEITDMTGGGPFRLKAGQWTDDTSMALCLAESLIKKKGFDPVDQMERYVRWFREGHLSSNGICFDVGITVASALRLFEKTKKPFCGSTDPYSAGNGSLMRLAPVPMFYGRHPKEAIEKSGESSRTTHGAAASVDGCRYFGGLLAGTLDGAEKEEILSERFSPVPEYWDKNSLVPEIDEIACGSFKQRNPPEIKGTGYVVKSLEASLWAFYHSNNFKEGALMAVNLGDDADTTGAIYGQIAGAYYGMEHIPKKWLKKISYCELITCFADQIFQLSSEI